MKILYISCHSVLEYDELKLFTELGHDCFSYQGAYMDPKGHYLLPRPAVEDMVYYPELADKARVFPKTEIPQDIIDQFDVIMVMHTPEIIEQNWERFKHKTVIWRTIGQSTPWVENRMKKFRQQGMKIVRYSPMEADLPRYIGKDVVIRFYKDPEEFKDWSGHDLKLINFSQSLKGRRNFCGHDFIMKVIDGFPAKIYGSGNDDLGEWNGGDLPYEFMKGQMRDSRVFVYGGTWPASYTLAFMEAWMTGIPIIAPSESLWRHKDNMDVRVYEVQKLISNGDDGFVNEDTDKLREVARRLLEDYDYAKEIGQRGRERAIQVFGKATIAEQWKQFLGGL